MRDREKKVRIKKKKLSECQLVVMSCGSYFLGILCFCVLGYFYDKLIYREVLCLIPICFMLLGAVLFWQVNIRNPLLEKRMKLSVEDVKEIDAWKDNHNGLDKKQS